MQKSKFNQFKYRFGLIKLALIKRARALFQKEGRMRLQQVARIMESLRLRNKGLRPNNQKIDEWVDNYIQQCILKGQKVDILTQWCLSKDLETRYQVQGNRFEPLQAEIDLLQREIPQILKVFTDNGVGVNWWVTFNGAFLDRGRISKEPTKEYADMLRGISTSPELILMDWEEEILGGNRPQPSQKVLDDFFGIVPRKAFDLDFSNLLERVKKYPEFSKTEEELKKESQYKIACEAEEGRFLFSPDSPFPCGQFILVPLEFPERYIFFAVLAPEFKKRIASIVKSYPWRMDADSLSYEL
ncbi:MAG: hypothetical protein A2655_02920 [Candidatus Yanofskybacteria bacterium RIFCSPHIGHO2_01_FULL_43_42]|uniref:Uncharacterized protein n=1 Tax=Candidatus Yanofskybacteria bacterium RIFCSPLOWO2_01_FULL_43_22 TaxID=1802695 RepID=A0A1F8GF65_9BACT|nr:MAG: hypothetical protein A2655_02920 [Candidatus Yanofskybacteria bacterium RIFCSPHIGHO2_01_FULL_43_42]OGN12956.1 MAG: hypothetical protein A3D48_03580 [Candidatus Yanofskybacteria bacterium RIFCSPHIGHO2_02_FULL_43_17]OGN23963.1 MAG: hypothetical protein A3A13_02675 [Candidatus Yanofskybacteria bacterium RIFCSPLOWO2_01_FULL_43_22]